jgi:hypothetical protein
VLTEEYTLYRGMQWKGELHAISLILLLIKLYYTWFILNYFLVVLGVELRSSPLLGRHSMTWVTPSVLFALVIFEIGVSLYAMASQRGPVLLFVLPHIAGMTGVHHHTHPLIEMGSHKLFGLVCLKPQFSPSSQDYRLESLHSVCS